MVSPADAEAAARDHLGPDGELGMVEFDGGWIAWAGPALPLSPAEPGDPAAVPATTSVPTVVVDRETGALTPWGSLPVPVIAAQYSAHRAAGSRFPPDVRAALEAADWWPGRNREAAVLAWLNEPQVLAAVHGLEFPPVARGVLTEFGGLRIPQGDGAFSTRFLPVPERPATDGARSFTARTGITVTPIGDHTDGPADLVVDPGGAVYLLHWSDDYVLGPSLDAAFGWLVRGGPLTPYG